MLTIFSLKQLKKSSVVQSILSYAAYIFMRLLFFTIRFRVLEPETIEKARLLSKNGKYIAAAWHQNLILGLSFFHHDRPYFHLDRPLVLSCLISASKDGDFLTKVFSLFGHKVFRGSTGKVVLSETRELLSHLSRSSGESLDFFNAVDGPRGPIYQSKRGILQLAFLSKRPIVPVVVLPSRYWAFRTWDRFRIPKPFSTVYIHHCKPICVDADTPKEQFASIAEEIKSEMLQREAEIRDKYQIKKHKLELGA